MGFWGKLVEREIHERFLKFGMAGIPEQIEATQAQLDQSDLIKVLGDYDITESELPIDIALVFHSLHKAVGDMVNWKVAPDDAPTPRAWNMLIWASTNQTKFMDRVLGKQLKSGRPSEDQRMRDTGESVQLIEIHKYSEYEVSQCVGNSPKTIRKYYMDLLHADHRREAEQELAIAQGSPMVDKMVDKSSVSPDNTVSHDIPDMVTREEVEQLLEAQKTAILLGLTVSLRNAPGAVEPFRAAIEELEKVHHRGVAITAQDHGKHRVGRIKAVSVGDNVGDTLPCPSENASDETGHADIESVVARFRDTHFDLTPASAVTT